MINEGMSYENDDSVTPLARALEALGKGGDLPYGLAHLSKGYLDYAKEVIVDRAICGIDGFKPSQRRLLYTMYMKKVFGALNLTKSATVCGNTMDYHPHGEKTIYPTLVKLVDKHDAHNVPFIKGKGNFSKLYYTQNASASRYTEVCLLDIANELFGELGGVEFVNTYNNRTVEPVTLSPSFPNILCNPSKGIAVAVATNIPPFNYHDVLGCTIEYAETKKHTKIIRPDFPTKGYYIDNEKELKKIMHKGTGSIKLRGSWYIEGKTIRITELPYGVKINDILDKAKDIPGVADTRDSSGKDSLLTATIECSSKQVVTSVLNELLRTTDLQTTMGVNITVIIDDKPVKLGVYGIIEEWVKHRRGILTKTYTKDLESVRASIPRYEILVALMQNDIWKDTFINTLTKQSKNDAKNYLHQLFPDADYEVFDWILGLSIGSLSGIGKKLSKLEDLRNREKKLVEILENVDLEIARQLKVLNTTYSFPRKTVVTNEDYTFDKKSIEVKADATPVIFVEENKFIRIIRDNAVNKDVEGIRCASDDIINIIDTQGRLLRIDLENLQISSVNEGGVYLPLYLEVEDDFDVVTIDLVEDKTLGYVYSDGFASVLDLSEWVDGKRCTRITQNGISPLAGSIIAEIDFSKEYIICITEQGRVGFASTRFKHKARTARTKLIDVKKGDKITYTKGVSYTDIMNIFSSPESYRDKTRKLIAGETFDSDYLENI